VRVSLLYIISFVYYSYTRRGTIPNMTPANNGSLGKIKSAGRPSAKPTVAFKYMLAGNPSRSDMGTGLTLPESAVTQLSLKDAGKETSILAEGIIASFPFQSTIETDTKGNYILKVNKSMQSAIDRASAKNVKETKTDGGAKADSGGLKISTNVTRSASAAKSARAISVEITRTGDEAETNIPADLKKALALPANAKAKGLWQDITPIARRDWIFWILTAKQEKTRAHRIMTAMSKLSSGMRRVCCFPGIKWIMKNG
jgi:hypothetical protein